LQTGEPTASPLEIRVLRAMSLALRRRLLLKWLRAHQIADVGFTEVDLALSLLDLAATVAKANLPGARYIRRRNGKLFIE